MNTPARRPIGPPDVAVFLLAIAAAAWLLLRAAGELNYQWDWPTVLSYIAVYDGEGGSGDSGSGEGGWRAGLLAEGFITSVRLMLGGGALAFLVGAVIALAALSPLPALRLLARLYVEGLRHLPPLVFMFIFFYFISSQLFHTELWRWFLSFADNPLGRFIVGAPARAENLIGGIICLALFEAAFIAEILRAGIASVEQGQWQAARGLGFSRRYTLRLIILPQAFARIAAPLAGQLVLLVKDSAILSVISVQELTFSAQETAVSTQQVFETWLLAAGLYFMLCAPLLVLCKKLEYREKGR